MSLLLFTIRLLFQIINPSFSNLTGALSTPKQKKHITTERRGTSSPMSAYVYRHWHQPSVSLHGASTQTGESFPVADNGLYLPRNEEQL